MAYFRTKKSPFLNILKDLAKENFGIPTYFPTIRYILLLSVICNGHLVYLAVVWYIFPRFGKFYQKNLAILAGSMIFLVVNHRFSAELKRLQGPML
jgi:hypothetical protein